MNWFKTEAMVLRLFAERAGFPRNYEYKLFKTANYNIASCCVVFMTYYYFRTQLLSFLNKFAIITMSFVINARENTLKFRINYKPQK